MAGKQCIGFAYPLADHQASPPAVALTGNKKLALKRQKRIFASRARLAIIVGRSLVVSSPGQFRSHCSGPRAFCRNIRHADKKANTVKELRVADYLKRTAHHVAAMAQREKAMPIIEVAALRSFRGLRANSNRNAVYVGVATARNSKPIW